MFQFNGADTYGRQGPSASNMSGSGLAGLGAGLSRLFGGYDNPADSASPYLDKIPSTLSPYYQPYIGAGQRALPTLEQNYMGMINSPGDLYKRLGEGYSRSPGYGYAMREGRNAIDQAAAAGGMLGSSDHQRNAGQMAMDLSNADFEKYMQAMNNYYGAGISGEEGLNKMGYDAGSAYGDILGTNLMNQADLAYNRTANSNQANADMWGGIAQGVGALFGV